MVPVFKASDSIFYYTTGAGPHSIAAKGFSMAGGLKATLAADKFCCR